MADFLVLQRGDPEKLNCKEVVKNYVSCFDCFVSQANV